MHAERPEQDIDAELGTAPPSLELRAYMAVVWSIVWSIIAIGLAFFLHGVGSHSDPPVSWPAALLLAAGALLLHHFLQAHVAWRWPIQTGWRAWLPYLMGFCFYMALVFGSDALLASQPAVSHGFRHAANFALIVGFTGLMPPGLKRRRIQSR